MPSISEALNATADFLEQEFYERGKPLTQHRVDGLQFVLSDELVPIVSTLDYCQFHDKAGWLTRRLAEIKQRVAAWWEHCDQPQDHAGQTQDYDESLHDAVGVLIDHLHCMADSIEERPKAADLPMLSARASAVYELLLGLPEHKGMIGRVICEALVNQNPPICIDESTLRKNVLPELKAYGLEHLSRIGYRIRPTRRPKGQ